MSDMVEAEECSALSELMELHARMRHGELRDELFRLTNRLLAIRDVRLDRRGLLRMGTPNTIQLPVTEP